MFNIDFGSKRAKSVLRFLSYSLSTVFVIGLTVLLVFATLGYDIDRGTGQVIQNGLVLVDSQPDGARVTIDDRSERDNTPGRFSLPEGIHTVRIDQSGYKQWEKTVSVKGSEVVWLYYPILVPDNISAEAVTTTKNAEFVVEVPGGQRLLIREESNSPTFTLATLSRGLLTNEEQISLPRSIFTSASQRLGSMKFAGWSSNDRFFLIKHTPVKGSVEYIRVDARNPELSRNLNRDFDLPLRSAQFINDDERMLYALVNGNLRRLNIGDSTISAPIISGVDSYKLHGDRFIAFISTNDKVTSLGVVNGGDEPKIIRTLEGSAKNLRLEFAKFDDVLHLAVLDRVSGVVTIDFDPHTDNNEPPVTLKIDNAKHLSFSSNGRFLAAQAGPKFVLYDFDEEKKLSFTSNLDLVPNLKARWFDGQHLAFHTNKGQLYIAEFDGGNQAKIGTSNSDLPPIYIKNQDMIYTFGSMKNGVSILNGFSLLDEDN